MSLLPNSELVAQAWLLAAVTGLTGKVATTLPDPPWTDNEFVQIMSVGGGPDQEVPRYNPVISLNCFAMKQGSARPPWGQAAQLANRIIQACYEIRYNSNSRVLLSMQPSGYMQAVVTSVYPVSDMRRIPSDPSQYAVYNLDLQFTWVPHGLVVT